MNFNWKKWLVVILVAFVAIITLLFVLGRTSEAKAMTPTQFCKKYHRVRACSPEARVVSVEMSQTVVASRRGSINCSTVSNYKRWKNVVNATLFWVRLKQYICFRGKRVSSVLPPEFTHGVTTIGTFLQFHDLNKESFSAGVIPWQGYSRGAYRSWAADRFEQKACVPVAGCLTLNTNTAQIWIIGAFNGAQKG